MYQNERPPYYYDYINSQIWKNPPSTVHYTNNMLGRMCERYLLQRAMSVFEWKIPKTWAKNYFMYVLFCFGFVGVFNTDKYGVIPQQCTLTGYDIFYQPTNIVVANPLIRGIKTPRIGTECALIKLQPDYGSIMDLIRHYAGHMACAFESAGVNMFNSKLSYVFYAENKSEAETYKKMFDNVSSGEPMVVVDKKLLNPEKDRRNFEPFTQSVKENYIYGDIISDIRKIVAMFDTEIGIPNANTDKKERLITDEVNANNTETASKAALWLESMQEGCEQANSLFGLDLSVDWRFEETLQSTGKDGEVDGDVDDDDSGAV